MPVFHVLVEGATDLAVVERILTVAGHEPGNHYGLRGKAWLDSKLRAYNNAARFFPWLVLRDLNSDAACAAVCVFSRACCFVVIA